MSKRSIDAPWVEVHQIQADFTECLTRHDRRSFRAILRIAIEQIEARPVDEEVVPLVVLSLGSSVSAAIEVYWYESTDHRHWQMMCEGIVVAILTVALFFVTSRWLTRTNRAEIKEIKKLTRDYITVLIARQGYEVKPLPKREFEFLRKLAHDDRTFAAIVAPIIEAGPEDVSLQFAELDL